MIYTIKGIGEYLSPFSMQCDNFICFVNLFQSDYTNIAACSFVYPNALSAVFVFSYLTSFVKPFFKKNA